MTDNSENQDIAQAFEEAFEIVNASAADNCGACGEEYLNSELKTIKLANISWALKLCSSCATLEAEDAFNSAVSDLQKF